MPTLRPCFYIAVSCFFYIGRISRVYSTQFVTYRYLFLLEELSFAFVRCTVEIRKFRADLLFATSIVPSDKD